MTIIDKVRKLKEEKKALLLAHNYQRSEVQEIADFVGDSLELAQVAARTTAQLIVFCGVRFMAETAKILSPNKKVLLSRADADCPMAQMASKSDVLARKKQYPGAAVVAYVNSTAAVKSVTDVCCTSGNARQVIANITAQKILFFPDQNLAAFCQRFTTKEIIAWPGYCYVHHQITADDLRHAKERYPDARVLVHPECRPEVIDLADETTSTSGMLEIVKNAPDKCYLIGTEEGLIERLKRENPHTEIHSAGRIYICENMKKTTIADVYQALLTETPAITLAPEVINQARQSLTEMLRYT